MNFWDGWVYGKAFSGSVFDFAAGDFETGLFFSESFEGGAGRRGEEGVRGWGEGRVTRGGLQVSEGVSKGVSEGVS